MKEIQSQTNNLLRIAQEALEWTDLNEEGNGLKKPINSIRRNLSVIDQSLRNRPSIAIFGQSQVGKSYLVQNLAKPFDEKYLQIKISDNEVVDFLTEMNPAGGKESTGLVSRFTTKEIAVDEEFPFEIELFSQLDIAAILANAFYSDLKDFTDSVYKFEQSELKELWDKLDTKENKQGVTEDDSFHFKQYIHTQFKDVALYQRLENTGYFTDLEQRLHRIEFENRWEILHYIWGQNSFLTHLFKLLSNGIKELEFNQIVRVTKDALTPNSLTILDVERVREILSPEMDNEVNVKLPGGKIKSLKRSKLGVLTREVQLQLAHHFSDDQPQSFLNHSDLLDFPGSKSRERIPLDVFENNTSVEKLQLLIRGKVSYLFDSYTNRLGVSTLLYCMDDTPPEEKEAPSRLHNWIKNYIGANKSERTKTLSSTKSILENVNIKVEEVSPLLVAFTKMNIELAKVLPGKENDIENHNTKWTARFDENFINFMLRPVDDKWIENWTDDREKFRFIFPIRDPLYSQTTFEGFETNGSETGIREERKHAMQAIGTSFINFTTVKNHTLDAENIWDEISSPNGTGIQFLSRHLKQSSHPKVTETRLRLELDKAQKELEQILKPYLISGNLDEDLKSAQKKAVNSSLFLSAISNSTDKSLSAMLNNFVVKDTEIWNLLYDYIFGTEKNNEIEENEINVDILQSFADLNIQLNPGMTGEEILAEFKNSFEGLDDEEIIDVVQSNFNIRFDELTHLLKVPNQNNSNDDIPNLIVNYWTERSTNLAIDEDVLGELKDTQKETFRGIIYEIIKSKDRLKLREIISDKISNIKIGAIGTEDLDLVASCSTTTLNKFLFTAGWAFVEENNKPSFNNSKIFSQQGKVSDFEDLDYGENIKKIFLIQWIEGVKNIFEENVRFTYNITNTEHSNTANKKLISILTELQNVN